MRLLGRDTEIGAIARALEDVRAGGQRMLAVTGEAGIGKSALLDVAARDAGEAGLLVLSARAAEHERDVPFGLVIDALDDHVATLYPTRLAALGPELEAVLPSIAALGGGGRGGASGAGADGGGDADGGGALDASASSSGPPAGPLAADPSERFRYHRALRSLLEQLGRERPLALLLDDVQWADEASVELLLHLLRRPPRVPFLLLFALRPAGPTARLLDAGRRAHGWDELRPAPLGHSAARALLPDTLDAAARERILHESDGNPLFLRELARGVAAGSDPDEPVPGTLVAAISQELDTLDPLARDFAAGAAIAGDPFDLDVAAAAADLGEPAALAALDALVAIDLVRPGTGRTFGFRHPMVHRIVANAAPPGWRLQAHARAAALLARRKAAPAARAYHVERFAAPGDEDAIALFDAAAQEALATSPAAAAHWFAAALRLLPHGEDARRAALLAPMALALGSAGRLDESRAATDECIGLLGPEDAERRASLIAAITIADVLLGEFGVAEARLLRALDDAPGELRPRLLLYRSAVSFFQGDPAGVASWSDRAAEALAARDPEQVAVTLAAVESNQALGRVLVGEPAGPLMEQAARRLEQAGDARLAVQVDAAWSVGGNLAQVERYAAAVPVLRRGMRVARETLQSHLYNHFHVLLTMSELPLLELDSALEHSEAAEEAARLQGRAYELAFALAQRARVLAACGRQADAERAAAESDELLGARDARGATATSLAHNAVVRLGQDPERLLAALRKIGGARMERINRTAAGGLMLTATRAAIAAEQLEEAERWAQLTTALAGGVELPATAIRAVRAQAELRLARGEAEEAAGLASAAARDAAAAGLRQEQLGAELLVGRALLAADERDDGLAALQAVAAEAGRLGAFADRDEAARELRRAGARISMGARRAADAAGRVGLTERELAVAELVARGHSNKQVAAALFLSEKTVERHLSRVYAKLGVRARTELAAALGG